MSPRYILPPAAETSEILNKIVNMTIGRRGGQYERPWHITFSCGNYGYYDTALCEMQGSPVKATVLVHLENSPIDIAVLDGYLTRSRKRIPEKMREVLRDNLNKLRPAPSH